MDKLEVTLFYMEAISMRQFFNDIQPKGLQMMKRMRVTIYEEHIEHWSIGPC